MRIALHQVILISDNAPTHPHPLSPPKSYSGSPQPHLTNVQLIYIDPNLSAFDAGIIAAFKVAYRRKYASLLVSRFHARTTSGLTVDWKINILEAINLGVGLG